jgi:hypothetical protein
MRRQTLWLSGLMWMALVTGASAAAGRSMEQISQEEVRAAVQATIETNREANGGVFVVQDNRTGENLQLEFEDIRVVRGLHGYGFFPNVIFGSPGE